MRVPPERRVRIGEGESAPVVPFVAFACPNACSPHWVYTYGVRGRIRFHRCNVCGQVYRSLQCPPTAVRGFPEGVVRAIPIANTNTNTTASTAMLSAPPSNNGGPVKPAKDG